MKKKFKIIFFLNQFFLSLVIFAQYQPASPYLQNPQLVIGYTDSCAQFWLQTWDNSSGGFFTNIDKFGNLITQWGTNKNMLTQSRNIYGLVRTFMLTGDTIYLNYASRALNWMYSKAWDTTYGGWFQDIDASGEPINQFGEKTAFYQHYAMLGILAYYEATGDTGAWKWIMKSYEHLENYFWDDRQGLEGYFDKTNYDGYTPQNKSFNATVDAITTHLLYLYLITEEDIYKDKLLEIANEIKLHLVASMPQQAVGFVEKFDSDWNWNNNETMTIMGHVLKTAWCLARINQLFPDSSYVNTAEYLIDDVLQHGYDHEYGGPYKDFNRITGEMLLWGLQDSTKAWWQMEQAIVAGLQMYNVTKEDNYLQMADETINFYMRYFVDHQYGEVYADRTRYGGFAWNEAKGNSGKAAYHSIETGYYTYLYGNLLYYYQPVSLYYSFAPLSMDREIKLTPLAIKDNALIVSEVLLNGQSYTNFDPVSRSLNLPAGTGGQFMVKYEPVITDIHSDESEIAEGFELMQNYPNPFNPMTKIKYSISKTSHTKIKVYDILGKEVAILADELQGAGSYEIEFDASGLSSGVYFYQLKSGEYTAIKKMILLK